MDTLVVILLLATVLGGVIVGYLLPSYLALGYPVVVGVVWLVGSEVSGSDQHPEVTEASRFAGLLVIVVVPAAAATLVGLALGSRTSR